MGNIASFVSSIIVDISNKIYNHVDKFLDFVSYHLCPDRPTNKLATDNLQIPPQDLQFLEQIGKLIHEVITVCITPIEMVINKKFTIHVFESSNVFTMNNQPIHNLVSTCDKILIYIGQNRNKIIDHPSKQIIKTVSIDNRDYDIPVNFWYNFQIDVNINVYIYIHCSSLSNYKGVVVAIDKQNVENLSLMKNTAINFYDQTLGVPAVGGINNNNNRINFI